MHTVEDKTVISDLRWYASDRYGLLITVGGDFNQTAIVEFWIPRNVYGFFLFTTGSTSKLVDFRQVTVANPRVTATLHVSACE